MRILDVGCHDGFVGSWLREQFGDQVELYGMELHPGAAQKARERGYVKVVEAPAEDAILHFLTHTFDVVVCFELIEHVPDPDRLLRVLERMVKHAGRILLSTPDGCFGTGNNPHHLRALRSLDVADMLRRRGRLLDMGVGEDGVTVACYQPAKKRGEVAIYTGQGWERWHPLDIATRGLGGSETAAYRLSEALSELGYTVTLYGNCDEGMMREVMVRDWRTFDPTEPRLALISSRIPELFDRPVNAERKLLWAHDTDWGDRLTEERAGRIDRVLALSHWHRGHLAARYPFAADRLAVIRNGITPGFFTSQPAPERERRVLYTSSPDRGLDLLLEMWPEIRERVPDATLVHTYAPVYDRIADQDPTVGAFREKIRKLSEQDGVSSAGGLSQPKLAELMRSSMVWAHPSYCTPHNIPFHETSCIGAMEAQAAGLCVVASNWGALRETVQTGMLIRQRPLSKRWRSGFIDGIVAGLISESVQAAVQTEGPEVALGWDWAGVGELVAKELEPPPRLATGGRVDADWHWWSAGSGCVIATR
jgi:glycosyltransferase involved in cell wall biosynthesis